MLSDSRQAMFGELSLDAWRGSGGGSRGVEGIAMVAIVAFVGEGDAVG